MDCSDRYYSQHSVEELTDLKVAGSSSIDHFIEELKQRHDILVDDSTTRSFLGSFGLQGRTATNPIGTLSGGQKVSNPSRYFKSRMRRMIEHVAKVRLALALVVYPAPDLLVLDEVSTHLDMVGASLSIIIIADSC